MNKPRVLVIANNSFSETNSNGRSLGNFFWGWPKNKIAELCISTDGPNFDLCNKYYCISDRSMLDAFLHIRKAKGKILKPDTSDKIIQSTGIIGHRKTAFNVILRHLLWSCNRWKSKDFCNWINNYNPDLIVLPYGDAGFMLDIGTKLSKEYNIPIVMTNTEAYYFHTNNYMKKGFGDWLWFPLFQSLYKQQVKKTMKQTSFIIHGNSLLKELFDKEFGIDSTILYTSSGIEYKSTEFHKDNPRFSYLGNLGVERHIALIEIAEVLQSINKDYYLDIYGKPLTPDSEEAMKSCKGIRLKGFISYEQVKEVIYKSDMLFHAESEEGNKKWTLQYAFSTKIADSLSSGTCFVLYAPNDMACSKYIRETGAGWYADNKTDLRKKIIEILSNDETRQDTLNRAKEIALKNHDFKSNAQKFQNILSIYYQSK